MISVSVGRHVNKQANATNTIRNPRTHVSRELSQRTPYEDLAAKDMRRQTRQRMRTSFLEIGAVPWPVTRIFPASGAEVGAEPPGDEAFLEELFPEEPVRRCARVALHSP